MDGHVTPQSVSLESLALQERDRLTRLCAYLSGDAQAAEDLAQDTLLEAFHHQDSLRDPAARRQWLWGIARNMCRRWRYARSREAARLLPLYEEITGPASTWDDPDAAIERAEIADALELAMAALSPGTRTALLYHYFDGRSHHQIAEQMGLSPSGVRVKLHRGRQFLRQVMSKEALHDSDTVALRLSAQDQWQTTRLWCPICGSSHLIGRFSHDPVEFALRCPGCCCDPRVNISQASGTDITGGASGFKVAFSRVSAWAYTYYRHALVTGTLSCGRCGRQNQVRVGRPPVIPGEAGIDAHSIYGVCDRCETMSLTSLPNLALALGETRSFWRNHARIRMAPVREITVDGRDALLLRVESMRSLAALEVVWSGDTYEVLRVGRA